MEISPRSLAEDESAASSGSCETKLRHRNEPRKKKHAGVINGELPSAPSTVTDKHLLLSSTHYLGMTKREAFAMAAMQGFCAADTDDTLTVTMIAEFAVEASDALLRELSK